MKIKPFLFYMSKIKGYGYSIWIVPYLYKDFMEKYKMTHIPHITIATNYETIDDIEDEYKKLISLDLTASFNFSSNVHKFPRMYSHDILYGYGFYCNSYIENSILAKHLKHKSHNPHMTLNYSKSDDVVIENHHSPEGIFHGSIHIVDTTSENPSKWFLIN